MNRLRRLNIKLTRNVLLVIIFISFAFSGGYYYGIKGYFASLEEFPKVNISREVPKTKEELDFALFWRVWDTLETKYFDKSKLPDISMLIDSL